MSKLERYRRYRNVSQDLHSKILGAYSDRELILGSAETLGIEQRGNDLLYDFESDMTVHFEFLLYEYQRGGQTLAEQYYEEKRWDSETERTILEATLKAETSLFELSDVDAADNRLVVTDLLNSGEEVSVLDVNLSQTAEPGVLLFFRPVQYKDFTTTSGIFFPFPGDGRERLLAEYDRRVDEEAEKPASASRFVAFYDLFREYGIRVAYK